MSKWRILIIAVLVLSFLMLLASEWLFERPWSWFPWAGSFGARQRFLAHASDGRGLFQRLLATLATFVSIFLASGLTLYLAPKRVHLMASSFRRGSRIFWRYALIGFLTAIAAAGLGMLSILSALTFPVLFLVFMTTFVLALMGLASMGYELGWEFFDRAGLKGMNALLPLAFGLFIIIAAIRIPLIGVFVLIVVVSVSLGVVISTRLGSGRAWTLLPLMEDE